MCFRAFIDSDLQSEIYILLNSAHESFGYTINIFIRSYTAKQKKGYQIVTGHDLTKTQLCAA